ncbi:MAG: hypothetical protein ACLPYW_03600 [Acidimicrobiales bacterium]
MTRPRSFAALAIGACVALLVPGSAVGASQARAEHPAATADVKPVGDLLTVAGSVGTGSGRYVAQSPAGLSIAANGDVIVADDSSSAIRSLSPTGSETVLAGTGVASYNGDARLATSASLDLPTATVPVAGGIAVADTFNERVRLIATASCATACPFGVATTSGDIYTLAGNGTAGDTGDGHRATKARLDGPSGLVVDSAGDLLIADTYSNEIRLVAKSACSSDCPFGLASTVAGDIYAIAGTGEYGSTGNGGPAATAELAVPDGLTVDASGDIVIADSGNNEIRLVAAASCSSSCPYGLPSTKAGDIYLIAGDGEAGHSGGGGPATAARLDAPSAVALGPKGDLLVADTLSHIVQLVALTSCTTACPFGLRSVVAGDIYTVAGDGADSTSGDGGLATNARLMTPSGVVVDPAGNLLIADPATSRLREVAAANCTHDCRYGLSGTKAGFIYSIAGTASPSGSGDREAASDAELSMPSGAAGDGRGDIFVADTGDNQIRVIAGATCKNGCPFGLATTRGDIYTLAGKTGPGKSGDRGAASRARLDAPSAVAVGASGDVLVADTGNNRIRLIAAVNCKRACPYGLASTKAGDIYTIAGKGRAGNSGNKGPATSAELSGPSGLAIGPSGDLLVADTHNDEIRLLAAKACRSKCLYGLASTKVGDIYDVAGTGKAGDSGDGGTALKAALADPSGVAIGPSGSLLIADSLNNRIRLVANSKCAAHCEYGITSTREGDIYLVAGNGRLANSGDQRPARDAALAFPTGVAVDAAGNLFIADYGNDSVRVVWNESCVSACPYGVPSTKTGEISVIAGNGSPEPSPNGEPAVGRPLAGPIAVASAPGGGVLVVEQRHNAIRRIDPLPTDGYSFVTATGGVHNFGSPFYGSADLKGAARVVGIAADPRAGGYWLASADGAVHTFGAAPWMGSMLNHHLRAPIVGIASTPSGNGYWLVGADGEVYPFGGARSHGSLLGKKLSKPVVAIASGKGGRGYWLVTSAGEVFSFGDAHGYGSAVHLTNIVGIVPDQTHGGYYLFGSDGRVTSYGDAHNWGSLLHKAHSGLIAGMAPDNATGGYRIVTNTGAVYAFHAPLYGKSAALSGVIGITTGE